MRLSLVTSIFLTLLLYGNGPVMALPLTKAQVQLAQQLQPGNFTQANSFQLSGDSIVVSYSKTSISGVPVLNYRDNNVNLNFSGQEINIQETELGQLITVTLETIPDLRTVTFSLILPLVNLSNKSETVRLNVPGITTTTRTTIAGPGAGADKTYTTVNLRGTAKFVVF